MIADILLEVVLPVFVLIAVGSLMQRAFNLDLYTLSKINFYFITPAAVFMSMYLSEMSGKLLGTIVLFYFLYALILYILGSIVSKSFKFSKGMKAASTTVLCWIMPETTECLLVRSCLREIRWLHRFRPSLCRCKAY